MSVWILFLAIILPTLLSTFQPSRSKHSWVLLRDLGTVAQLWLSCPRKSPTQKTQTLLFKKNFFHVDYPTRLHFLNLLYLKLLRIFSIYILSLNFLLSWWTARLEVVPTSNSGRNAETFEEPFAEFELYFLFQTPGRYLCYNVLKFGPSDSYSHYSLKCRLSYLGSAPSADNI